ncbi:unnamed protein product [Boreogadus saida]
MDDSPSDTSPSAPVLQLPSGPARPPLPLGPERPLRPAGAARPSRCSPPAAADLWPGPTAGALWPGHRRWCPLAQTGRWWCPPTRLLPSVHRPPAQTS